jgi:hypothetical protein
VPIIPGPFSSDSSFLPAPVRPQHPAKSTANYSAISTPIHPSLAQSILQTNQVAPATLGPSTFASHLLSAPAHPQQPTLPIDVVPTILGPSTSDPISTPAPVHPQPPASPIDVTLNTLSPSTSDPCLLPALVHPQRPAKPRKFWVKFDVGAMLRLQERSMTTTRNEKTFFNQVHARPADKHSSRTRWRPPDALLAEETLNFLPYWSILYSFIITLLSQAVRHGRVFVNFRLCIGNDAGYVPASSAYLDSLLKD